MTKSASRYNVTITVERNGGHLPSPAEFALADQQAASAWAASVVTAHTTERIISVVVVQTADRRSATAIATVVVSETLGVRAHHPAVGRTGRRVEG